MSKPRRTGKPGELVLILRPEPAGRDEFGRDQTYRLKLVLKRLLRNFGLRCIRIEERDETHETR